MVRVKGDKMTGDLLEWQPPQPRVSYRPDEVRGATLAAKFSKAVSLALKECELDRAEVAAQMSNYLGEKISEHMLNAYASEGRAEHKINVHRFAALIHVTGDHRLLSLLAEEFGFSVVDDKYMPLIRRELLKEQQQRIEEEIERADRTWRGSSR